MLHKFLTENRNELIVRCRGKVAKRFSPSIIPAAVDHGVPVFLRQLADTLRCEQSSSASDVPIPEPTPASSEIGRTAALHGADMLRRGYAIDQVVHDYGDVCQAVTELAREQNATITLEEFHTLNRCLDNAIADAVTSFGRGRDISVPEAEAEHKRFGSLANEQRRVLDMATQAFTALKIGNIGLNGETGAVLGHALVEARALVDRLLTSGTTVLPSGRLF